MAVGLVGNLENSVRSFSSQSNFNLFKINIISEFHLFGVNLDFHSSNSIRNADVDFSIESSKSSERRVNRVRSIRSSNNNDVRETIRRDR